jgi:hypothetical protein
VWDIFLQFSMITAHSQVPTKTIKKIRGCLRKKIKGIKRVKLKIQKKNIFVGFKR